MKSSSSAGNIGSLRPELVVTVSVGDASRSVNWDGEAPHEIGHPVRWRLERTDSGVRIVHAEAPGIERAISAKELASGIELELPEPRGVRSLFTLRLQPTLALPPAFKTHEGESGELRIYSCRGVWTRESASLDEPYTAYVGDDKVFTVRKSSGGYSIKPATDDLVSEQVSFERGQEASFTEDELVGMVLNVGEFQWRFDSVKPTALPPGIGELPEDVLNDAAEFKKAMTGSLASVVALVLVALVWPKPPADQVPPPPQLTKLVLKQPMKLKHATSAPSGTYAGIDKPMGEHRHAKVPKHVGTQKIVKSTAEKGPKQHKVAQHSPSHSHSHSSAIAHSAPPKPGPLTAKNKTPGVAGPKHKMAQAAPRKAPSKAQPTQHDRDSEIAKAFHGAGFRQAEKAMVNGGMTQLLRSSSFGQGSDAHSEARGLLGGRSALSAAGGVPGGGGGGGAGGGLGTRSATVASMGGGAGLFGDKGVGYGKGSHAKVNGQGRSFVSMDTGESDVDEGLTKEQVGRVIHSHYSEIRYCYDAAKLRNSDVEGKLAVRFTVGGSGGVVGTGVNQSTLGDSELDNCILRRLATWHFPHPKGGVNVAVTYPFVFKTLGR